MVNSQAWFAALLNVMVAASCLSGYCAAETAGSWDQYRSLADNAYKESHWQKARQLYELCLRESEALNAPDKTLTALKGLAAAYTQLDEASQAQPLYERALDLARKQSGEKTPDVVAIMLDLASCYESQGNHRKAEPIYTKVLQLNDSVNGNTSEAARTYHRVALHYMRRSNFAQSEKVFQKAMPVYEASLGVSNSETQDCKRDYRDVLRRLDRPTGKSIATDKSSPASSGQPAGTSDTAISASDTAAVAAGTAGDAARTPLRAPITSSAASSSWSTTMADSSEASGNKQLNEANVVLSRAPGEQLGGMFATMMSVSTTQKRYNEAEPLYKKVISIDEQSLGPDHPGLAADLNNLALLYVSQKKWADAEPLLSRAVAIYNKAYGADNLVSVTTRTNLAETLLNLGRFQDADKEYRAALDGARKVRVGGQYQVAKILNAIGYMNFQQGNLSSADAAYAEAVDASEKAFGSNSKMYAACLDDYSKVLRAENKAADAEQMESRAARIFSLTSSGGN